jgi:GNAT superfamily N-acetyltransferase
MEKSIKIRKGTEHDVVALYEMIKQLAEFEKEPDAVIITPEILKNDGFGERPLFEFLVAEVDQEIMGIALYYYAYSTWKGKFLYLEDLVVKNEARQLGIGSALLLALKEKTEREGLKRMGWQVLDWNESAIKFYEKHEAEISREWFNGRFNWE